ncbi:hypothetical protein C0991_010241 [Blastosporella zonata]|nr:hypothetical protein C0991_010241 [Blastosporella zonata]
MSPKFFFEVQCSLGLVGGVYIVSPVSVVQKSREFSCIDSRYDSLKRHIYQLEKEQHGDARAYRDIEANEQSGLLGQSSTDAVFEPLLDKELKKITLFYEVQEKELLDQVVELEQLVTAQEDAGLTGDGRYYDDDEDEEDDDDDSISRSPERRRRISSSRRAISRDATGSSRPHRLSVSSVDTVDNERPGRSLANRIGDTIRDSFVSATGPDTVWTSKSDYAYDTRLLFKRKITTLYVAVSNLKSYVEVNHSGFRKILKKYDKVTYSELKDRYMRQAVETTYPFTRDTKTQLDDGLQRLVALYTKCVTHGDKPLAAQQLKLHQRENIAWERDTVWRQMIAQQRRGEEDGEPVAMGALYKPPGPGLFYIPTPLGTIRVTKKMIFKIIAGIIFVTLLNFPVVEGKEANRCFAILMFCTFLWATEAIALFVTSMFVPLLLVVLQVIRDDAGKVMTRQAATK